MTAPLTLGAEGEADGERDDYAEAEVDVAVEWRVS